MDNIGLLYDHYKDTCEIQRNNIKVRNRLFGFVIFILVVLLLLSYSPDTIGSALMSFLNNEYGIDITIELGVLQSFTWVVLLYFSIRYYQSTINIERMYPYIHITEERLNELCEMQYGFDREGKNYLDNYPICMDVIDFMYKWLFPVLYILAITIKIITERRCSLGYLLDMILYMGNLLLCILYIVFNRNNKKKE